MNDLFSDWHNEKYLEICLHNLEEKAMCGGVLKIEWMKIYEHFRDKYSLWNGGYLDADENGIYTRDDTMSVR